MGGVVTRQLACIPEEKIYSKLKEDFYMKKLLALMLSVLLISTTLSGCDKKDNGPVPSQASNSPTAQKTEVKRFKVSHTFLSTQAQHTALEEIAKNIKDRTDGSCILEVYANAEMPTGADGVEQCVRGAYFINVGTPGHLADWVPDAIAYGGPFLFENEQEYVMMQDSDTAKKLIVDAEKEGIKILNMGYYSGMRHLATKKPVRNFQDLQNMKIRTPNSKVWTTAFTALGASPVGASWSEIYNGVSTGVFSGLEATMGDLVGNQFWEIIDYVTLTGHYVGMYSIQMSSTVFNDALTPEEQQIFQEEFDKGMTLHNELFDKDEAEARTILEEHGVEIIEIDRAPFVQAIEKNFYGQFDISEGFFENMKDDLMESRG